MVQFNSTKINLFNKNCVVDVVSPHTLIHIHIAGSCQTLILSSCRPPKTNLSAYCIIPFDIHTFTQSYSCERKRKKGCIKVRGTKIIKIGTHGKLHDTPFSSNTFDALFVVLKNHGDEKDVI